MLKTVAAESFFSGSKPSFIPDDAVIPEWTYLLAHTNSLDTLSYPIDSLKTILGRENERIGAHKRSLESIDKIDSNTLFVVCGQQAGLFGGPLYTLYKALHSIGLADRISEASGKKIVPLFWVASDDHDFDEVKDLGVRTQDGSELRIEYIPSSYHAGMPVGDILIDDTIGEVISTLEKFTGSGGRAEKYIEIVRRCWKPGTLWSGAFSTQMAAMCSSFGLVILDPRWEGVKHLYLPVMERELDEPLTSTGLVNTEADIFESTGRHQRALRKPEHSTNLFVEIEGIRHPVHFDGIRFTAGTSQFAQSELLDLLRTSPGLFSPGAALRPVCQDFMLPTAATIGGPGERIYLGQIQPLYDFFNVHASVVWPRASFTVIDKRITRAAEKESIETEKFFDTPEKIRSDLAYDSFPETIMEQFDTLERAVKQEFGELAKRISTLDQTLVQSVEKDKGKVIHILDGLKERAVRAHKNSINITGKRLASTTYFLRPSGVPQERWFGADVIFSSFGEENFQELIKIMSPGEEHHRLIFPEE